MRPTGATNPISILLLVAVLAGIYWAVLAGPKYLDNLTVREIAETSIPQAYQASDQLLMENMLERLNNAELGWHREDDPNTSEPIEVPGLGLSEENVTLERDELTHHMRITIRYTRDVHLVPTKKWTQLHFEVVKEGTFK